jgi:hypothetical protein
MSAVTKEVFRLPEPQGLGFVEPHEVDGVKKQIDDLFVSLTGKPFEYRTAGYFLAVRLNVKDSEIKTITRDDGSIAKLYRTDRAADEDKYQSTTGLVCGVGPQAYRGTNSDGSPRFPDGQPWCRIGDFVHIPRQESIPFSYRGVAMGLIADDRICGIVQDPDDVQAIHLGVRL